MSISKTADSIQNKAHDVASHIKDGSEINILIGLEVERRTESKIAPLFMKMALEADLKDELDNLPIPGSTEGNNPDVYEERVPTGKPGSFRKRKGSFWKDFAMTLPRVAGYAEHHKAVMAALADNSHPLAAKGKPWLEAEKKMYAAKITAGVALVTKGAMLYNQEQNVLEYDGVTISYTKTKAIDGTMSISRVDRPYILGDTKEDENGFKPFVFLSPGEFLALDTKRAEELGGGFANLLASRKRESEAGSTKFNIKTAETFEDALAAIANYFEDKQTRDQMAKWLAHARKKNKAAIKTFGDVYITLGTYWPQIKADYRALENDGEAEQDVA